MKRSVDILGVGTVEPTEIWSPVPREGLQRPLSATGGLHSDIDSSGSAQIATLQKRSPAAEHQGEAERGSVTASGSLRQSLDSASLSIDTRRQERTSRNFLGRIFKKRGGDQEVVTSPGVDSKNCKAEDISSNRSAKKRAPRSLSPNPAVMIQPTLSDASKDESVHLPVSIGQPTFGTTPSIQSADRACAIVTESGAVGGLTSLALPPPIDSRAPNGKNVGGTQYFSLCQSSRPVGYSWKISKWSKKRLEKWIRQLGGSGGNTLLQTAEGGVVFEWVKLRMPQDALNGALSRKLAQAGAQPTVVIGNQPGSNRKTPTAPLTPSFSLDAETREAASVSPSEVEDDAGSHTSRSNSHVGSASIDQPDGSLSDHTIDSGDESEPEDSETPWTCSVWIKRTGLRIPLATLTPAPHHPKVIGVLKIPTELDLVRLGFGADAVERRSLEAIGLSEENVKDVVCVTAMWLVAREEFGGLGKKRRGSKI
ncbi:hypothetical protein BD324DRAFT_142015 [Kockovaella imperatae]|uniref:Uncharacterized protein n=1 Tax=Kockovaella imperatae TaxID=4999 RepID=A0A1Y1U8H4_9TREE|nr:hypothetical protein BD324DRAFT_142015 [Kockovaella imperatae]ORX34341.1 hypothetical protein BD324DRAFT_142015 [Kockovaella imperatae]